ncbi:MAG: lytic polysaccharide monooxygenase [Acidobacteriota bacterium]
MDRPTLTPLLLSLFVPLLAVPLFGHGLMESPASRNWFCGAITKPDQVANGTAAYPVCGEAFAADFNGGYSFMSVLTHDVGRSGVSPLPPHVCGFGSETWNGGATPWDTPIDWPTNSLTSGRNEIVWNISWGPHFDDTEEFRYWITTSSFQYQVGVPLTWSDFEAQPFCVLTYDDASPGANPDVVADKPATRFHTFCDVPPRSGRHVIYGEWGRNEFTFERFHGCIDAVFGGGGGGVDAAVAVTPDVSSIVGAGSLQLDGSGSVGSGLSYLWSVAAADPGLYSLSNPSGVSTQLSYAEPVVAGDLTVTLTVSDGQSSDNASRQLTHTPSTNATFELLGPLTAEPLTLTVEDRVTLRAVLDDGSDVYYPSSPLVITSGNGAADAWPVALANAINAPGSALMIGVLGADGVVSPVADATANQVYARLPSTVASTFLEVSSGSATCELIVNDEWNTGFTATVRITNGGTATIEGWQVGWEFTDGSRVDQHWNAVLTGSNPYSAADVGWNGTIAPGASAEFGFVGVKGGAGVAIPRINGSVCN